MKKLKTALPIIRNYSYFSNSNICQCKTLEGSSKSNGCISFLRQYSIFNDLIPEETTHKEEECETVSVLEKLIIESKELENVPTRSEMVDYMKQHDIRFLDSEYRRFIRTDCLECGASQTNLISTVDGQMTCTACDATQPFLNYKCSADRQKATEEIYEDKASSEEEQICEATTVSVAKPVNDMDKKKITVRKTETTKDDETTTREEKEIEETLRRMESPDNFDSDLYDNVSYLNLMSKYNQINNKKKDRHLRVRDDSDAPSPRAGLGGSSSDDGAMSSVPYQPDPQIKYLWNDSVDIGDMIGLEMNDMMQLRIMLGVERISTDTLSRYNVRGHIDGYDQPAVLYPRYRGIASRLRIPSGLKVIRKIGPKMEKENYPIQDETLPRSKFSGIFGYHMVTASDRMVVLTTNERDALAVYEATDGALAFALPQGERVDSSVFPYLEDFDQIYLWFPIRHLDYAKEWGTALNASRCFLVKVADRPIEMVRNNRNTEVKQAITSRSVRMRDKGFRSMTDIREEVKADLIHSSSRQHGLAQWKRFSALNKYLLGFRPGELTVLTGGTGFGKTTFLCEYALDLFTQGVRTLFCSFEMPEEKILKWMLVQYAALPLYRVEYSSAIDSWLDKFERTKGPLTILKTDEFLMNKNITDIAKAISQHVINNGCQHVVIDNLQFLVNQTTMADDSSSGFEKFHHQDRFVGLMRKMATDHQVHVTMVVHPRKTDSDTDLDIQHFGGSARVTQEADNVLAIQRRRDDKDRAKFRKFLYILKNRYGGRKIESDQLEMVFQPGTYSHTLIDHSRN